MDFLVWKLIITAFFQNRALSECLGKTGAECCFGFSWDSTNLKCKPCKPGYDGINCSQTCRFPSFGLQCQGECQCTSDLCDFSLGCVLISTIVESSKSKTDVSETYKMTPETEIESNLLLFGLNKEWLIAVFSLLCTIIVIILSFLCCGKKLKRKFCQKRGSTQSKGQEVRQSSAASYIALEGQGYFHERNVDPNRSQGIAKVPSIYEEIDTEHPDMGGETYKLKLSRTSSNRSVGKLSTREDASYLEAVNSEGCNSAHKMKEYLEKCADAKDIREDRKSDTADIEMCHQIDENNSYLTAV